MNMKGSYNIIERYWQTWPFFDGYEQTLEAIRKVKTNGVLELILDPKKNFAQAFKKWAHSEGHRATNFKDDNRITRLFIRKLNLQKTS